MKTRFLICIFSCFLLFSCSKNSDIDIRDRIVSIEAEDGRAIGKWVIRESETLLTATHVYDQCLKTLCRYRNPYFGDISIDTTRISTRWDMTILRPSSPLQILSLTTASGHTWDPIFALVMLSGSWQRVDGSILGEDVSYIGYDENLAGRVYSGALETDIVLSPGESGTPIWNEQWELIGIMSASDAFNKRGWIVQ